MGELAVSQVRAHTYAFMFSVNHPFSLPYSDALIVNKEAIFAGFAIESNDLLDRGSNLPRQPNQIEFSPSGADLDALKPCSREGVDDWIILNVATASHEGHHDVAIHISDSDVVFLVMWGAESLRHLLDQQWIAPGTGRNVRLSVYLIILAVTCHCYKNPVWVSSHRKFHVSMQW